MLTIALTGGIGSGKTTIAGFFAELGIPVISSDQIAREVVSKESPALEKIVKYFGKQILQANAELDRHKLREIVFANQRDRLWLEKLLHPLIRAKLVSEIRQLKAPYCVLEIPLLFESKISLLIDRILVVDTTENLQIQRTQCRDNMTYEDVEAVLQTQVSRDYRLARADDVIINDGDLKNARDQVMRMHQIYLEMAGWQKFS